MKILFGNCNKDQESHVMEDFNALLAFKISFFQVTKHSLLQLHNVHLCNENEMYCNPSV